MKVKTQRKNLKQETVFLACGTQILRQIQSDEFIVDITKVYLKPYQMFVTELFYIHHSSFEGKNK